MLSPLAAVACEGGATATTFSGGWVGAGHERGHRLRSATAVAAPALTRRCSVAIVGAGVAGLAAGRALRRAGVDDLRIFELEDDPGGNSRGHAIGGMACPLGAHYLPLPGPDAVEVSDLLHELGLAHSAAGRTVYDERHLCHSPQERLWVDGHWRDGLLLPAPRGSAREAQYHRFAAEVATTGRDLRFTLPTARAPWSAGHAALDAQTFAQWLDARGLTDPGLRWYLDYACRDDYGAGAALVSAWAGVHYFASRHGFAPRGDEGSERDAVLTWPEGNAWLVRRLAAPLHDRLRTGQVTLSIDEGRHDVAVDVWSERDARVERWLASHVVLAVPLHVAARIVRTPVPPLRGAAARVTHAPWLVANLHVREALTDKPGAPASWDNVIFGSASLGYVDAMHQSLRPVAGATVLTAYWALGGASKDESGRNRARLLGQSWSAAARVVIDDLARAHPDLPRKLECIDLMRYGHAMAIPAPGVRGNAALAALARTDARVHFAHSDLSGYSVFEEAFCSGERAGSRVAGRLNRASTPRYRPARPAQRG